MKRHDLAGHRQGLAAGGHDGQPRTSFEQAVDALCRGLHDVLAVVHHEQQRVAVEAVDDMLDRRSLGPAGRVTVGGEPDGIGDGGRHGVAIVDRGERDDRRLTGGALPGEGEGEAGLARTARPDEGEHPAAPHLGSEVGEQRVAPDKRRQPGRQ
jgi:hypothetical protein